MDGGNGWSGERWKRQKKAWYDSLKLSALEKRKRFSGYKNMVYIKTSKTNESIEWKCAQRKTVQSTKLNWKKAHRCYDARRNCEQCKNVKMCAVLQ